MFFLIGCVIDADSPNHTDERNATLLLSTVGVTRYRLLAAHGGDDAAHAGTCV